MIKLHGISGSYGSISEEDCHVDKVTYFHEHVKKFDSQNFLLFVLCQVGHRLASIFSWLLSGLGQNAEYRFLLDFFSYL
jgi:hypothetical protein